MDINTHQLVWRFRGQGGPSEWPPPFDTHELVIKKTVEELVGEEIETRKKYDSGFTEEENIGGFYRSRNSYQISTQYAAKGKYQFNGIL